MKLIIYMLLFHSIVIFSQNLIRIPLKSSIYYLDDNFYINNGEAPNFFSRPYSYYHSTSKIQNEKYYLEPLLGISLRVQSITNDIPIEFESYFYNRWVENEPLLKLGFIAGIEYFVIYSEFDIHFDYFGGFNKDTFINIPYKDYWYQDFDFNFPTRGYLALGNKSLQLFVGRDKIKFGPGQKANLLISQESSFYNQINLSFQIPSFKGTFFFIPLESYLTNDEKDDITNLIENSELIPGGNFGKDLSDQSKYLTGHRYEFKPYKNFVFAFTDMLLIGGRFPNFEDIPPTMFYHNIYGENYSNVMIGFDFFWTILNGLGLYGEYIIDDIRNTFEDGYSVPNSMGYLGGLRFNIPGFNGRMVISLEAAYTDPFTYKRWHPYMAFYNRRKLISTSINENKYLDSPIGFFLGSDSMFISTWINYSTKKQLNFNFGWEYWNRGLNNNVIGEELILSYANYIPVARDNFHIILFEGSYHFSSNLSIDIKEKLIMNNPFLNIFSLSVNITL